MTSVTREGCWESQCTLDATIATTITNTTTTKLELCAPCQCFTIIYDVFGLILLLHFTAADD